MTIGKLGEETIFNVARKIEAPDARAAYLRQACGDDPAVLARVQALLMVHEAPSRFLESPNLDSMATLDFVITEKPGTVIGPYKLLEQIGEGGMGVVFMAEQTEPVRRKVALKVIRPGMDTRQVIARFEAERQALALMDHPNIAKVLDGGLTGEPSRVSDRIPGDEDIRRLTPLGSPRPFFVMELVKGVPITAYCEANKLTPQQRLELFIPVCQAVQHAHQKGIIHRDLKPSNVLVTLLDGQPMVKVIDFGVAKAAGQALTDKTLFTGFAQMIGTPLYMSPEQAAISGQDVDTRSDVYSLGVLLYELLTGTTPFDRERFRTESYDEIRRIIREEEPPRPSLRMSTAGASGATVAQQRRNDPRRLGQLFRGELDWIVMKCLEKDRNRRYETASALGADVRRYLNDEPVAARPPSAGYRLRKFARRNKGPALAATVVLLALVGGVIGTSWGLVRAGRAHRGEVQARQRAEENLDVAYQILDEIYLDMAERRLPREAQLTPEDRAFLQRALRFYERFADRDDSDPAVQHITATACARVGRIRYQLGEHAGSIASYEKAIVLLTRLAADGPERANYQADLVTYHGDLGGILHTVGRSREAEDTLRRGVQLSEEMDSDAVNALRRHRAFAGGYNNLAILLQDTGRLEQAETVYHQGIGFLSRRIAENPNLPWLHVDLAGVYSNLGALLSQQKRYPDAAQAFRQAQSHYARLPAEQLRHEYVRQRLCHLHFNRGILCAKTGLVPETGQAFEEAARVAEKLAAEFPNVPAYQFDTAMICQALARWMIDTDRLAEARQMCDRSHAILKALLAAAPTVPAYRERWEMLISSFNSLAVRLQEKGRYGEAVAAFRRALEMDPRHAGAHNNLAWLRADCPDVQYRDSKEAVELARKGAELAPENSNHWYVLALAHYRARDWQSCLTALEKSTKLNKGMNTWHGLLQVMAYQQLGRQAEARKLYDEAVQRLAKNQSNHPGLLRLRAEAAEVLGIKDEPVKKQ